MTCTWTAEAEAIDLQAFTMWLALESVGFMEDRYDVRQEVLSVGWHSA